MKLILINGNVFDKLWGQKIDTWFGLTKYRRRRVFKVLTHNIVNVIAYRTIQMTRDVRISHMTLCGLFTELLGEQTGTGVVLATSQSYACCLFLSRRYRPTSSSQRLWYAFNHATVWALINRRKFSVQIAWLNWRRSRFLRRVSDLQLRNRGFGYLHGQLIHTYMSP